MSRRARVRRVAALDAQDWRALVDAVLAAAQIELFLRTRPLSRVIAWAESRPPRPSAGGQDGPRLHALSAWPYRALGVSPSCLRRSLVLTALLRKRRQPAVMCVGVRKSGTELRAHAWVECGAAVFDTSAETFERLQPPVAAQISRNVRWFP